MPFPNPATQFQPGNSGGPGRPPGSISLTAKLRAVLDSRTIRGRRVPDGMTVADLFIEVCLIEALKGKYSFAKEILDRIDGKVVDKIEMTDARGIRDLAEEILAARKARADANGKPHR